MRNLIKLLAIGLLAASFSAAQAASITLNPSATTVAVGGTVDVTISFDFTDVATLGGAFDLTWDNTVLAFDSWTISCTICEPAFGSNGTLSPGLITSIAFGSWSGINTAGPLGVATFSALNLGDANFGIHDNGDTGPSGWFIDFTTYEEMVITYNTGAAVNVTAVPVPAAFWMFSCALTSLMWMKKRKIITAN